MILGHSLPKIAIFGMCSGVVAGISNFQALCHVFTRRKRSYTCSNKSTRRVEKRINSNWWIPERPFVKEKLDPKKLFKFLKYVSSKNTAFCLECQERNEVSSKG